MTEGPVLKQSCCDRLIQYLESPNIQFAQKMLQLMGPYFNSLSLFEWVRVPGRWENALNGDFSPLQKNALQFFLFGSPLTSAQVLEIFSGDVDLFKAMQMAGLILGDGQYKFRLDDYALQVLPTAKPVYLWSDLPRELAEGKAEPSAQISATTLTCLSVLGDRSLTGIAADYGSGTGALAIVLLKQNPKLTEVVAIETDVHALALSQLNARMNQVAGRFTCVNPDSSKAVKKILLGKRLSFAVSNFPGNPVPEPVSHAVSAFGNGGKVGTDGLAVFVDDIVAGLNYGSSFVLFSYWAARADGSLFASDVIQSHLTKNLKLQWPVHWGRDRFALNTYVRLLKDYLKGHALTAVKPGLLEPDDDRLQKSLERAGVASVVAGFALIR